MKRVKNVKVYENPNILEKYKEFEINGIEIKGGCFPGIFCIFTFCPALKMQPCTDPIPTGTEVP